MKRLTKVRQNTVVAIVIALACTVILVWAIPAQTSTATAFGMPPALMPTATIAAALELAVLLAVVSLLSPSSEPPTEDTLELPNRRGLLCLVLVLAAILLIAFTGLFIGGVVTVAAFMLTMGERRPVRIALVAIAAPGGIELLLGTAQRLA
jgi:hypothetical protein